MTTRIRDRRSLDEDETDTVTTAIAAPTTTTIVGVDRVFASRGARLLAAAFRLTGNRHDAEDLMQDAFSRACAQPTVFAGRNENQAEAWLWTVMRRAWKDRLALKGSDTFSVPDHELDELVSDASSPLADCERDWTMAVVYEALERLGPKHRLAMVMLARGMSETQSAQFAGVSRRTVREWRRDARRAMGLFGERLASGQICRSFETSLSAFADGEHGPGKQLRALEAHLNHCGHCRGVVAQIRRHSTTVAGVLPVVGVADRSAPVDLGDLVHIGQHTADAITHPRGGGGVALGLLSYLEDHWRLAVVAAAVPVLASAMVMQWLTGSTASRADTAVAKAPAAVTSTPQAGGRPPGGDGRTQAATRSAGTRADDTKIRWAKAMRTVSARSEAAKPARSRKSRTTKTTVATRTPVATPAPRAVTPVVTARAPSPVPRTVAPARRVTSPPCRTTACAFAP